LQKNSVHCSFTVARCRTNVINIAQRRSLLHHRGSSPHNTLRRSSRQFITPHGITDPPRHRSYITANAASSLANTKQRNSLLNAAADRETSPLTAVQLPTRLPIASSTPLNLISKTNKAAQHCLH